MAKIAVVEDNDAMRAQLCGFIAQYAQESGHQLDVTAFSDGAQLVEPYRPGFDIIFLDIEMPKLGGMPTAERIRRQDPDVVLVFVTNMAQYAIRGYEVDALDFVLKPVSYYQFSTKLERALQRIQRRRGGQVALQVSGGVQLLDTDDILYLETRDRLLHYHTATDTWSVRGSLLKAEKDLAAYHFARCNQCYLVNLRHVRGVQDDLVQVGEERLEISRRQRTAFLAALALAVMAAGFTPLAIRRKAASYRAVSRSLRISGVIVASPPRFRYRVYRAALSGGARRYPVFRVPAGSCPLLRGGRQILRQTRPHHRAGHPCRHRPHQC